MLPVPIRSWPSVRQLALHVVVARNAPRLVPPRREGLRLNGVAQHLRPQRRVREVQHVHRGHPRVVERREERVRNQVFPRVVPEVSGVESGERDVGERIGDVPRIDAPAALYD